MFSCRSQSVLQGFLIVLLAGGGTTWGRVYSPRVVTPHLPDTYSARTFAAHAAWKDLPGPARARAMFEYLASAETGVWPGGGGVLESGEKLPELGRVRDPVRILNCYGTGPDDVLAAAMAGLWEQGGNGAARVVEFPGGGHAASELETGGTWSFLDVAGRGAFVGPTGLRSRQDALQDPAVWQQPSGPRFFPTEDLASVRERFTGRATVHQLAAPAGHTMDYILRRGETFTRWWKPQGGRWLLSAEDVKDKSRREIIEREPRGPKPARAGLTEHTYGNGRFDYHPDLSQQADVDDGLFDVKNIVAASDGLKLASPGEGWIIFEVRSPYVIVPQVGKLDDVKDDQDASVVDVDATDATLAWSPDSGDTWITLEPKQWPAKVDLTAQVAGSYGYLLKISLKGKPEAARVRSLKISTWVQLAPATLPRLVSGDNALSLRTGDHNGMPSRVRAVQPNAADENAFLHYLVRAPREYDPASRTGRARGPFLVRLGALPRTRIAWFSAGATGTAADSETEGSMTMEWAAGTPRDFQPLLKVGLAPGANTVWNVDAERQLDQPASAVYVRMNGVPALSGYRLFAHCLEDPRPPTPVRITHVWKDAGQEKSQTQELTDGVADYHVQAANVEENVSVTISVPSSAE